MIKGFWVKIVTVVAETDSLEAWAVCLGFGHRLQVSENEPLQGSALYI